MNDSTIKDVLREEDKNKLKIVRNLLEDIIENIDLLLNGEIIKKIQEAEEDIKEGRVKNWNDFEKEFFLEKSKGQ